MTPLEFTTLARNTLAELPKLTIKDVLARYYSAGFGAELDPVFSKRRCTITDAATHHFQHIAIGYKITADNDLTPNKFMDRTLIADKRNWHASLLLLKVAFEFYQSKIERPRVVLFRGNILKEDANAAFDEPILNVMIDLSYAIVPSAVVDPSNPG